jgi:type IV secretory pathway VirB10-like protein
MLLYLLLSFVGMNKKRGVVVSTSNHPKTISKSKSAHTHPLPPHSLQSHNPLACRSGAIPPLENEELAESNLLSEEPERMVNQAYYTYQEPESNHHHDYDKYEENEEYVIQSMQRRKELKERERKEEEKRKVAEKSRAAAEATEKLKKEKQPKLKPSGNGKTATLKSLRDLAPKEKKPNSQTVNLIPLARENAARRETIIVSTKPKPL